MTHSAHKTKAQEQYEPWIFGAIRSPGREAFLEEHFGAGAQPFEITCIGFIDGNHDARMLIQFLVPFPRCA